MKAIIDQGAVLNVVEEQMIYGLAKMAVSGAEFAKDAKQETIIQIILIEP